MKGDLTLRDTPAPVYFDRYEEHVHIGSPSHSTHFTTTAPNCRRTNSPAIYRQIFGRAFRKKHLLNKETGEGNMSGYFKNVNLGIHHEIIGDCIKCGAKGVNMYKHLVEGCDSPPAVPLTDPDHDVIRKYKIHRLHTVNGHRRGANNNRFYESYDEAVERSTRYVQENNCGNNEPMVIFQAIKVISRDIPPVKISDVE